MVEHISTMTSLFSCTAGLFYAIDKLVNSKMQLQFLKVQVGLHDIKSWDLGHKIWCDWISGK